MKNIYIYLIFILFVCSNHVGAQIQYSISFERNKLSLISQKGGNGVSYTLLKYEDCVTDGESGFPSLPFKFLHFIVPNGSYSFSASVNSSVKEYIYLANSVYPIQPDIPTLENAINQDFKLPDNLQYSSSNAYPSQIVSIVNEGYFDGDKRIITVKVSPVQYVAANKQLIFNSTINFTINFNTLTTSYNRLMPLSSNKKLTGSELSLALSFVKNKADIVKYAPMDLPTSVISMNMPVYEYVVITTESLAPAFNKLISWKRMKGLNAGIITMQKILNDPTIKKDEISNLSDNAGKLRQYLRLAYQNGTKYVLLAGNDDIVPIRYGSGYSNGSIYDSSLPYVDTQIPSDLYYADLNGNWNKDGDEYLGESEDQIDYYPELFVGRILCKNEQEAENYVDKLIVYEKNPGNGSMSYLRKAFYSQMNEMQTYKQAQTISNLMKSYFSEQEIYEEYPSSTASVVTFPSGKETIDKMNENFGFMGFLTHGEPYGMGVAQQDVLTSDGKHYWSGITSYDNYCGNYNDEVGNGVDCLTNFNYPFVAYSTACTVTPFDKLLPNLEYNMGEALTIAGKYGAVAFLANTRYGWVSSSKDLMVRFINTLPLYSFQLGKAEAISKTEIISNKHWLSLAHNLIGCPELKMWTAIPSYFGNVTITRSNNNLSVNTQTDECDIVVKGLFSNEYIQKLKGNKGIFWSLPKNYEVIVHKYNCLPYIAPLYLQNEEVVGTHYIIGDRIFMGENVDNTKQSGEFVIKAGANITIEASENVTLDKGFKIEKGASFKIK